MDIASTADRRGIAEMLRYPLDRAYDCAFAHGITVDVLELTQGKRRQICPGPGPKILGGDFLTGDFPQICIHLG